MNATQIKKLEIMSNLSFVPQDKLDEVNQFIRFILHMSKTQQKRRISVRGIWRDKGFENIDIEKEVREMRREVQDNLDRKEF